MPRLTPPRRRRSSWRVLVAGCFAIAGITVVCGTAAAQTATVAQARASSTGPTLARTVRAAPPGVQPNGASDDPSLSYTGQFTAFSSQASNLGPAVGNGRQWNIYVFDSIANQTTLISSGPQGAGNGPSTTPVISSDGSVVAFASTATNLVANTSRHISDIFVRTTGGPAKSLSVGPGGVQPDGASTQPAISANGLEVAFASGADNLVAGDDNAVSDIFVANVGTGAITRVSVSSSGAEANGASYNPSLSGDGTLVSFTSTATNLAPGGHGHTPQVYVHNMTTGKTQRVSVSSGGKQQNASVPAPFTQFSDLSADGHYIVFDSNATNLVHGLTGAHTEVFRHSMVTGHDSLVSQSSLLSPADNDSFYPATSADGRITVFDSFADDLVSPWAPVENVFAQDLDTDTIMTPDVTADGAPRGMELDAQLLQHAAISGNGEVMAFMSGADNLVPDDYDGVDNVFLRVINPPSTNVVIAPPAQTSNPRPTVEFSGSGPSSTLGLCVLGRHREICPMGKPFRLPKVNPGPHTLYVYAGDSGLLFDPTGVKVSFTEN